MEEVDHVVGGARAWKRPSSSTVTARVGTDGRWRPSRRTGTGHSRIWKTVGVTGPGGNAVYTVKGYARFHLTGYRFGPKRSPGPEPCSLGTNCIKGYFVRYVTPSGVIGGADFGVSTVKLVS